MPTVTFKPIIVSSNRRKDGTYPVKIRVTFKGVSRRLATNLLCYPSDVSRAGKIKSNDILRRGQDLCDRMQATLRDISPFTLETWDVDRVVAHVRQELTKSEFQLNFFAFGANYAHSKGKVTGRAYTGALAAFARYLGKDELDINDITKSMLLDFVDFIEHEPKVHHIAGTGRWEYSTKAKIPKGASSRHLMKLAHIFNKAKERYNDEDAGVIVIPRSPFDHIPKPQPPAHGQSNLGQEVMQQIISAQTADEAERQALDTFILAFCLMGVNLADMYSAVPPAGGEWRYNRQKTAERRADHAEMRVTLPEEAAPYLERLGAGTSKAWWLPVLHGMGRYKDAATVKVNKALARWAERNGISRFTFGACRHTWATLALKWGVDKALVDECLVHVGDFRITDIYAERSWERFTEANRVVLSHFIW